MCRTFETRAQLDRMNARFLFLLPCVGVLTTITGCSRTNVRVPTAANVIPANNSYMDLEPGGTLRIVVPSIKSGGFLPTVVAQQSHGKTISLSAANVSGYEVLCYAISGKKSSAVRLKFESAELSRDGKMLPQPNPPTLPFQLPQRPEYIRLIYLVRVSQADHNMAIVASKSRDVLDSFTKQLKQSPNICHEKQDVFCSWVPVGVAVRPMP